MKRFLALILLLHLVGAARAETPRRFALRFYQATCHWRISGTPDSRESRRIAPYFSGELLRLFRSVNSQRQREGSGIDRMHLDGPDVRKGSWSKEGDLFSDSSEGFTSFRIGRAAMNHGRMTVQAQLEWRMSSNWTDTLVLDHAGKDWVVADIRFASGETLVSGLQTGIAETEDYLRRNGW